MPLETIYVTRHGFRSNWLVDHITGQYSSGIKSPTGIPTDPALTAHGVAQSKELAAYLLTVQPPIEKSYSSPYYRCLQTIEPYVSRRQQLQGDELPAESNSDSLSEGSRGDASKSRYQILCESGLSEWYGSAPFEHPTSAPPETLRTLFPALLDPDYQPTLVPTRTGESIDELHDRVAATMEHIITQCDRDGTRSVLLCTHAAVVIALGRVLTGVMPVEIDAQDFGAFTCGLSVYKRRERTSAAVEAAPAHRGGGGVGTVDPASGGTEIGVDSQVELRDNRLFRPSLHGLPEDLTKARSHPKSPVWRGGLGVSGGWDCTLDSDCSFLSGGEERGWRFAGDESFRRPDMSSTDAGDLGVVVEGKSQRRNTANPHL